MSEARTEAPLKEIPDRMGNLKMMTIDVLELIGQLRDRLSPVLSNSRPTDEPDKPVAPVTPLGQEIHEVTMTVKEIELMIFDITEQLEL